MGKYHFKSMVSTPLKSLACLTFHRIPFMSWSVFYINSSLKSFNFLKKTMELRWEIPGTKLTYGTRNSQFLLKFSNFLPTFINEDEHEDDIFNFIHSNVIHSSCTRSFYITFTFMTSFNSHINSGTDNITSIFMNSVREIK